MNSRRIQSGKSYWQQGCEDGKAGKSPCQFSQLYPGYLNGYNYGKDLRMMKDRKQPSIPIKEEAALRHAFEGQMQATFGYNNFLRTTQDGYSSPAIQAAWFACRCGWICGNNYGK